MEVYLWREKQSYDILEKQCQMGHVGIQLPETARVILRKGKATAGVARSKAMGIGGRCFLNMT